MCPDRLDLAVDDPSHSGCRSLRCEADIDTEKGALVEVDGFHAISPVPDYECSWHGNAMKNRPFLDRLSFAVFGISVAGVRNVASERR
jgi:hypothetical protein